MDEGEDRTCFVLTTGAPAGTEIRQHTDGLVEYMVGPAVEGLGYAVVRMDDISEPDTVSDAVMRELRNAELVVADLSFGDANVMYALGVRHSFGMPTIHVLTPSSVFPFDVEGLTAIVIDLADPSSVDRARKALVARIQEIVTEPVDLSPVLATARLDAARQRAAEDEPVAPSAVMHGMKAIEQRLAVIERRMTERDPPQREPTRSRRVFIVHGHDDGLKHHLARLLHQLEFEVVILQERADSGRTLLDKLRAEIDDIGFVFVLLTPDDTGVAKVGGGEPADRARQNVIFEHGLFSGLLEPSRVCAIQRGDLELPSDLYGLIVKQLPEGAGIDAIQLDLVHELKRAGYDVDANLLMGS